MAATFGDLVPGGQPVNETNCYAAAAYRGWGWPPGDRDGAEWALAVEAIHFATAEAAVRLKQTGAPVASIFGLSTAVAHHDDPATSSIIDRFYNVHWSGGPGLFRDGVLNLPGRDRVERADLAGSFDLIGFSYYSTASVSKGRFVLHPTDAPVSPLGYGIWADGLGLVLDRLHEQIPGTPLLIAEYGIGTDDDEMRAAYLERCLYIANDARERNPSLLDSGSSSLALRGFPRFAASSSAVR